MKSARNSKRLPVTLTAAETEALLAQLNPQSTTGLRNRAMLAAMLGACATSFRAVSARIWRASL